MDIERLTKSQIILLTLLVSFVTSIATGIVTVSLMEQAPPSIAQTVNRVVERTVETVVPAGQSAGAATPETVVITEADSIAKAVAATAPSVVRLYTPSKDEQGKDIEVFLGLGVVVSDDGLIATDAAVLPASGSIAIGTGSTRVVAVVDSSDPASGLAILKSVATAADGSATKWQKASFAADTPALGETVVSLSGQNSFRVARGIVAALPEAKEGPAAAFIEANLSGVANFGSPFINTRGEVVGISTVASRAVAEGAFLASPFLIVYTSGTTDEGGNE